MNTIQVKNVLPYFLSDTGNPVSEVWCREFLFEKGKHYLVSATSGEGKSSMLSYIFGERTDYNGDILFDDRNINLFTPSEWHNIRKNKVGFVFQGLRLFSELTVIENIMIKNQLTMHKTTGEINVMLEQTGLIDKKNDKAGLLSFGQQQRIAIIRALCQPFDFLLMDEPFSHLDDMNIRIVSDIIQQELLRRNAGLIICSLGPEYEFHYHCRLKL